MKNGMTPEIIDWFSLAERMDNDEAYIKETIDRWFTDHSATMETLSNAVLSKNADDIYLFAHKLKGSSAIFGMNLLSQAAGILEVAGMQSDFGKIYKVLICVKEEFEKARAYVSQPDWIELAKQQCETKEDYICVKE